MSNSLAVLKNNIDLIVNYDPIDGNYKNKIIEHLNTSSSDTYHIKKLFLFIKTPFLITMTKKFFLSESDVLKVVSIN